MKSHVYEFAAADPLRIVALPLLFVLAFAAFMHSELKSFVTRMRRKFTTRGGAFDRFLRSELHAKLRMLFKHNVTK